MGSYVLSCCSTADLSEKHFKERDINYICFHYRLDGNEYFDDLGKTMSFKDFYNALENGSEASTSQVSSGEYLEYFTKFLEQGLDILHVCLSTGLSGTYNSAWNAAAIASERFPDRKVIIVDSLGGSSGFGLLMDKLADLRDEGMGIDELAKWAMENRLKVQHWFFSTDLTFFYKGGRISKSAMIFGGILNICPVLHVNSVGALEPVTKARGRKMAMVKVVNEMKKLAIDGENYSDKCYISHSACYDDAREVADLIESQFPKLKGKILINDIGTTIGSHTGPGTVALFYWGQDRKNG
ncbi:MAG: DegV family protein [Clostridia bacterium]|nr:DegV family protein [Clostridia bacterium]